MEGVEIIDALFFLQDLTSNWQIFNSLALSVFRIRKPFRPATEDAAAATTTNI